MERKESFRVSVRVSLVQSKGEDVVALLSRQKRWQQEANFGVRPRDTVHQHFFTTFCMAKSCVTQVECLNLSEPWFTSLNPRITLVIPSDGHVDSSGFAKCPAQPPDLPFNS